MAALSGMKLTHLSAEQAAQTDREVFPAELTQPAGGPPALPKGQRIVRWLSSHAVDIALPHGRVAVMESSQPMTVGPVGHRAPVDLGLKDEDGVYVPARPLVSMLIPKYAQEGVQLPGIGVSLTPVGTAGAPLAGAEGMIDGASLVYANTQAASDTVVKPTIDGMEMSTVLRSASSPRKLFYRVGLPPGARLVQSLAGSGTVQVMEGARTMAVVRPPGAMDAAGTEVQTSLNVQGDILVVTVSPQEGDLWPIAVDPELATIEDNTIGPGQCHKEGEPERESGNWCSTSPGNVHATWYGNAIEMYGDNVNAGEYAVLGYHTQGESKIYAVEAWTAGSLYGSVAKVEFARKREAEVGEVESQSEIVRNAYKAFSNNRYCVTSECSPANGAHENVVAYKAEATGQPNTVDFSVQDTNVYIAQEKGPEATFNENEAEIEVEPGVKRQNVLYDWGYYNEHGEGNEEPWLGPHTNTAFQVKAHDPGIGVAWARMFVGSFKLTEPIYEEGKCNGVQCNENYSTDMTYNQEMSEGEPTLEWIAADLAGKIKGCPECIGMIGRSDRRLRVDAKPPEELEVTGWPVRREISAAPHALTVSATDEAGLYGQKSSGVKSIAVSIDGGPESMVSGASCAEGPCSATGTYTLHAEDLSEGVHRLVVTATDNAENVAAKEFTFDVRHGTPMPVGPGSVDPTTGQLKLSATDVSLAGSGGVSRVYQSRNVSAGAGGPLGPQWALSLGAGQGLTQLPDGSMVLASSAGGTTTFLGDEEGEYESPLGDENIKLEAKEKEAGGGISQYLLKDAKAGTTTVFTRPVGTEETAPVYATQFGQEGAGVGNPMGAAIDENGDVWVTDYSKGRIFEFSAAGLLLKAYGSEGHWLGNFSLPWGVAVNKSTGNVYVTDEGNSRIVELSSSGRFIRAFGWGVAPGAERKDAFQNCTSYCYEGIRGSGPGQLNGPKGIAVDASGNVWVAEYGNNRVQEFNENGAFIQSYGGEGSGDLQFKRPEGIVVVGNDVFVADSSNKRVDELTTSGAFVKAIGWGVSNGEEKLEVCTNACKAGDAGTGKGEFSEPWGLAVGQEEDLYVSQPVSKNLQELTTAGTFVTEFQSHGTGPNKNWSGASGVAVSASGSIYVTDYYNRRVEDWMRPTWLPSRTESALKHVATAYAYKPVEEEGKVVIEPTEVLAPAPNGIECVGEHDEVEARYLKPGCRALTFNYAETTTAKGEAPSEWGDYVGHLTRVYFHAAVPGTETMKAPAPVVAHYLYDSKGRLRAVWDPRTEPKPEPEECVGDVLAKGCLATVYGYDQEGHVTSVTPPGEESWAFVYGTIPRDSTPGRLLKVTRAPASAQVWTGEAISATEAPKLSGTPVAGVRMAASDGKWAGEPVAYAYQWEDCNAGGGECSAIPGATNASYTPKSSDVGHALLAEVTATNGGGSAMAATKASTTVASSWTEHSASKTQLVDGASSINAVSCIPGSTECVVSDANGNAFYASNVSATGAASWERWNGPGVGPSWALDCPSSSLCLMAAGEKEGAGGALYYATSLGGSWAQAYNPVYGVDAISCPSSSFCGDGQDDYGYFRWSTSPASSSWELEDQSAAGMKGISCLSASFCAIVDNKGRVHVATTESQVKSSSWTETDVDGEEALNGIACISTSVCVAVDGEGDVLSLAIGSNGTATVSKQNIDAANRLSAVSCAGEQTCVAVDDVGDVFVSVDGGESWKRQYTPGGDLTSVSCASSSLCVAADTAGNVTSFDPVLTQLVDSGSYLTSVSCIPNSTECVVGDGKGNAYYATDVSAESPASWRTWSGPASSPSRALDCPSSSLCLMAAGEKEGAGGALYYATSLGGSWTQAYNPVYGVDAISCPSSSFCGDGQDNYGYFRWSTNPASSSWELEDQSAAGMKGISCLSASFCAIVDNKGRVHVATTESQVKSSSWTETDVDGEEALAGVACMSTSSCVAVDGEGDVLSLAIGSNGTATVSKQKPAGSSSLAAVACAGSSTCAAVGLSGVFVSTDGGESWSREYHFSGLLDSLLTSVSCASSTLCATVSYSGNVTAFDPESSPKVGPSYTQSVDGGSTLNAVSCVPGSADCVVGDGKGNAFYATNVSTAGTPSWKAWSGPGVAPSEAVSCPAISLCVMAAGEKGKAGIYYATVLGGGWTLGFGHTSLNPWDAVSCASSSLCVAGEMDERWVASSTSPASTSWKERSVGGGTGSTTGVDCLSSSFCATVDSTGHVHVTTGGVEGTWTETDVDGSSALNGVACTSSSECLAVDDNGNVVNLAIASGGSATTSKQNIDAANSLNAISCSGSTCATVDSKGNVFTSTDGGQVWGEQYSPGGDLTGVSCASGSLCVTVSAQGETTAFNPSGIASEASERSPQPGSTIEYNVPVSGEGAPQNLSKTELEKWGQADDPSEATAIFPPDEPQGWPASGYKKATVDYMDEEGRTVNTRAPSGGVSTTEYNEANEVVRTLSPQNRVRALAEGAKSAEAAEHLSTVTEYNPLDDQIVKTLGPEHEVKLKNGEEVQARAVTHNYYDEGAEQAEAKNHEEYNLLTKSVSAALLSDGEEKEKHTTVTSYDGQNDLGWVLRQPTSTTVDPEGSKLTTTTVYSPSTGNVVETRSPGAGVAEEAKPSGYVSQWGKADSEPRLSDPYDLAVGPKGDIWVADTGHGRVVKLGSKGEFIAQYGSEGSGDGQFERPEGIAVSPEGDVWVADTGNDRVVELSPEGAFIRAVGSEGSEDGKFKEPSGIAVDAEGHVWVADTDNNRLQELSATGEFIRAVGAEGAGEGQFKELGAIAVDAKGDIWVSDTGNSRIQELSSAGAYLGQFKVSSSGGVAVSSSGDIWVSATLGTKLVEYTPSGQELASLGAFGKEGGQLIMAWGIAVDKEGNVWVADSGNDRVQEFAPEAGPFGYLSQFGKEGTGEGQFKEPGAIAVDAKGDIWVSDTSNDRVQELSPSGALIRQFGSKGKEDGEFELPEGIAIDKEGNIWVVDTDNSRVQEFSPTGTYITQFKVAALPLGVAVDSSGNVWVTSLLSATGVQEFSPTGEELRGFGASGTGNGQFKAPWGLTIDPEGHVWVADFENNRIQEFSATGEYMEQYAIESPRDVVVGPEGHLWVSKAHGVEEMSLSGQVLMSFGSEGTGNGQFKEPWGLALDGEGHVWVADSGNDRIQKLGDITAYSFAGLYPSAAPSMQFASPKGIATDASGDVWVADTENHRIQEVSPTGKFLTQFSGSLVKPEGVAIDSEDHVWVTDASTNKISEFSSTGSLIESFGFSGAGNGSFKEPAGIAVSGEDEYVVDRGDDRVQEFNAKGEYVRQFGTAGTGNGQLTDPQGIAVDAEGNVWVADAGNNRVEEFSSTGIFEAAYGSAGTGNGQFEKPEGLGFDSEGDIWVADTGNGRVQELSPEGAYIQQFASEGSGTEQLEHPAGLALDPSNHVYVLDTGNDRVQEWISPKLLHESAGSGGVHGIQTIYYSPGEEAGVPACQNHPEWAGLPCRVQPAAQPTDAGEGKPSLPVSTMTYNIWDEVEKTTEEFGSGVNAVVREKIENYDAAGRAITSEETSTSSDAALPKVTNEYNQENGALESQSETFSSGEVKTTSAKDNTLGQMVEYRDASGNVVHYRYEDGGDGRLLEVSEGAGEEAQSKQSYSYDETTGLMSKLVDSGAGTFTASYDLEGQMTSEVYPNGMCANTGYDSVGAATSISYIKTRNCSESNPTVWFNDSIAPGIYGETLSQESTLSKESYAYDELGRLIETQETPAGKGCVTRLYAYDEESNRLSSTTREPTSEGICATEGGTVEAHSYDEANRLIDEGVEYEALGNITAMPAVDAGGHELTSTYYVDGQVATQQQNDVLDSYVYDPAGRTMQTVSENIEAKASVTVVSHYAGPGEAVTWTSENGKWTRNIPGIGGGLEAVEEQGKEALLQLHDLQGNIVATAVDNEAETKLYSTYNSTEFGVPSEGKTPPKYAWLGAGGVASETAFGTGVFTQGGASYVPQVARDLQTAAIEPPGAFPNGQGTGEQYGSEIPGWYISLSSQESAATLAEWTAYQEALKREAEGVAAGWGDPVNEGILTGKEALAWINTWEEEAFDIKTAKENGACEYPYDEEDGEEEYIDPEGGEASVEIPGCADKLQLGMELEENFAKKLKWCYDKVHNGKWSEGLFISEVCYFRYTYTEMFGLLVATSMTLKTCADDPPMHYRWWYCSYNERWFTSGDFAGIK